MKRTAARAALTLITGALPWAARRRLLERVCGYELAPSSRIGLGWIEAERIVLGDGARIGHLSVFRRLELIELGDHAATAGLNWVASHARSLPPDRWRNGGPASGSALVLGRHAVLTARHYLDCTHRIELGEFSAVGGWRSVLLTRAIDLADGEPYAAPITIGRYCIVAAGCVAMPGAMLPDHCLLGARSLLGVGLTETHRLCAGSPARPIRRLAPTAAWFTRTHGVN